MINEVYYPYNVTFKCYHDLPLAGKRAFDFIEKRNQEKGGIWELHTSEQYSKWYESVGKEKEAIAFFHKHGYVPQK